MIIRLVTLNLIHLYDDIMIPVESFSSLSEYHYYFHINSPVLLLFSSVCCCCCCCCYIRFMGKAPNIRWKNFLKPKENLTKQVLFWKQRFLTWLDCRWFFLLQSYHHYFFLVFFLSNPIIIIDDDVWSLMIISFDHHHHQYHHQKNWYIVSIFPSSLVAK